MANKVLKEYLIQGYSINNKRLEKTKGNETIYKIEYNEQELDKSTFVHFLLISNNNPKNSPRNYIIWM